MNQKKQLKRITGFSGVKGPVVTIVMDGDWDCKAQ